MNGFSGDDYEFAAGSIFGMRSWGIDDQGRLHGVTHREVWRPGENVAVCKATRQIECPSPIAPRDHLPAQTEAPVKPKSKKRKRNRPDDVMAPWERELLYGTRTGLRRCGDPTCYRGTHTVGTDHTFDPSCECGFWAYDEHGFTEHGSITGIIEGYGKTTIGTKGFRCEKAKIAALCREGRTLSSSMWRRLQMLYPDAQFYATKDEMLTTFDGVMKSWEPVGEGFWDQPVPVEEDAYSFGGYLRAMNRALAMPPTSMWRVGP